MKLIRITTVPLSLHKLLNGQMRFMSKYYEVVAVSSPDKLLDEVGLNEGVRTAGIDMSRKITLFKDIRSLIKMICFLRKEKPSIVHTHTPKAGIIGLLAARFTGVPIRMHTVAGLPLIEATGWKRKLLNVVEKLTYFCATHVYPNSQGLKTIILNHKFTKEQKLKIIANGSSNGIDTTYFDPTLYSQKQKEELRKSLNIHTNDFVFIFIGRLVKDKGINELVGAFGKLEAGSWKTEEKLEIRNEKLEGKNEESFEFRSSTESITTSPHLPVSQFHRHRCKLLLVGDLETQLDPLLPETIENIKLNKNIVSVGWQDDVRPYLTIADALVFPSYREGFPNVVMQAGAMGLPSIVTDINGCNEIIIEGENGMIVPPKDEEALCQAMMKMANDSENRDRMASKSREMICDRYEQRVVWEALLEEYERLLAISN